MKTSSQLTSQLTSQELMDRASKIAPGGVHSPVRAFKSVGGTPVYFQKAQGAKLWSVEGKEYIDFCQSFGPLILGHRDPDVAKKVHEMVDTAWSFGACEPYSLDLAEFITSRLPWVEKLRFVSSGTEAVMSALRVARAFTKRNKILKFDGCYHGHADSMLVKSGSGLAGEASSDSAGVSEMVASETLVAKLNDLASVEKAFAKYGDQIAAVIIEPLPANYGMLIQTKEFLSALREICTRSGSLLIFDEVISGFRVALGGMVELMGVKPDLVTYGKVIGGGFPVGCYGGRREIMDLIAPSGPVYQAGTLSANPVGMVSGLATLQKVEKVNCYCELEERAQYFTSKLNQIFERYQTGLQAVSFASLFWIHGKIYGKTEKTIRSLNDLPAQPNEIFKSFFHKCLDNGVYLAPSAYEVGFLSFAHDQKILDEALTRIEKAIKG